MNIIMSAAAALSLFSQLNRVHSTHAHTLGILTSSAGERSHGVVWVLFSFVFFVSLCFFSTFGFELGDQSTVSVPLHTVHQHTHTHAHTTNINREIIVPCVQQFTSVWVCLCSRYERRTTVYTHKYRLCSFERPRIGSRARCILVFAPNILVSTESFKRIHRIFAVRRWF